VTIRVAGNLKRGVKIYVASVNRPVDADALKVFIFSSLSL